jgi:hypothetical protein
VSRFANLSERLSADLPNDPPRPDGEEDETTTSKKKDKEKYNMTQEVTTAEAKGHAAGFKEATDRMNAVFASGHYAGREASAHVMLGNAKFSADEIIGVLAAQPKVEPAAINDTIDTEATERADLRKNLAENQPQSLGNEGGEAPKADDADPVIKAAAKVNAINGL